MVPTTPSDPWPLPELTRARRAIVVVDVVESVRLMQEDEAGFIERWRRFVHQVRHEVLPKHGGRMVKSLGDGMLLVFETVPEAVSVALAAASTIRAHNASLERAQAFETRTGVHLADVAADDIDIYGAGVNLASRLAGLANAGEVVASAEVCDRAVIGFDIELEDLGDCFLKHVDHPVRAFRIGAPARSVAADRVRQSAVDSLKPTLFVHAKPSPDGVLHPMTTVVADDLCANLARCDLWHVLSRLSAMSLAGRDVDIGQIRGCTGATSLVLCSVVSRQGRLRVHIELADARNATVLWSDSFVTSARTLFNGECEQINLATAEISRMLVERELARSRDLAMPNLESYALLLQGIAQTHTSSRADHDHGRAVLEHLTERHPRKPEPHAWIAKHLVIRIAQGWTTDAAREGQTALAEVDRALSIQPDHPFSLAMRGHLAFYVHRDLLNAGARCNEALRANPNESLAWLFLAAVHAHQDQGDEAVRCVERARLLAPLDPMRYYYDGFSASAMLAAGRYEEAVQFGARSVQANAAHAPSFLTLTVAQALGGQLDAARRSAQRLKTLLPRFSTERYVSTFPGGRSSQADRYGAALLEAGAPP